MIGPILRGAAAGAAGTTAPNAVTFLEGQGSGLRPPVLLGQRLAVEPVAARGGREAGTLSGLVLVLVGTPLRAVRG